MKQKEFVILAAGLLIGAGLAIFIFFVLYQSDEAIARYDQLPGAGLPESAAVGSPAPDFNLNSLANENIRLSELRGKIVVINFWATWCEPCKVEMPFFEELYNNSQYQLEILAVNFDEPRQKVQDFVEEYNLSFPVLLDPGGKVQELYRVRGYPTTFIVDKDGVVRYHHIGLITEDQIYHYLGELGAN